jgi:hypothetical protein
MSLQLMSAILVGKPEAEKVRALPEGERCVVLSLVNREGHISYTKRIRLQWNIGSASPPSSAAVNLRTRFCFLYVSSIHNRTLILRLNITVLQEFSYTVEPGFFLSYLAS